MHIPSTYKRSNPDTSRFVFKVEESFRKLSFRVREITNFFWEIWGGFHGKTSTPSSSSSLSDSTVSTSVTEMLQTHSCLEFHPSFKFKTLILLLDTIQCECTFVESS
ncbi:hypothetical protein V6N12_031628 [Hibiscus sabdariffa]|uniref:Uncharacterized protein n=1 Tax=Hibiscus sabdariffa TaxID=183260 RepID=A0ABR2DW68_9ROSI